MSKEDSLTFILGSINNLFNVTLLFLTYLCRNNFSVKLSAYSLIIDLTLLLRLFPCSDNIPNTLIFLSIKWFISVNKSSSPLLEISDILLTLLISVLKSQIFFLSKLTSSIHTYPWLFSPLYFLCMVASCFITIKYNV